MSEDFFPEWARKSYEAFKNGYGFYEKFNKFRDHFKPGWGPDGNYKPRDTEWVNKKAKEWAEHSSSKWEKYFNPKKTTRSTAKSYGPDKFTKSAYRLLSVSSRVFSRSSAYRKRGYPRSVRPFKRRYRRRF